MYLAEIHCIALFPLEVPKYKFYLKFAIRPILPNKFDKHRILLATIAGITIKITRANFDPKFPHLEASFKLNGSFIGIKRKKD